MHTPKLLVLAPTDELSLQVERVVAGIRPRPGVVWCERIEAVDAMMSDTGPYDVLIAAPLPSGDGFAELRRLRVKSPQTQLVLALRQWRSTELRQTVRAGALDVLRLPVSDADLLEAIEQALEAVYALAAAPAAAPRPGHSDRLGSVIAVVSASGGSGKTFLATNLAYHLQCEAKRETCLIDLDLQFGELSTALRLRPRHTIHDVLFADGGADDLAARLDEHLERHESGICVLAAPEEPAQADGIEAVDVARVLDALRLRFDCVVVDTPTALSEPVLTALEQADQVFVLATLDLPSVRNLGIMLTTLKQLKVAPERISLLLNKVEPDVGIDVARVEQYFPQGFSMVIPYGREVNRSLNMGQPVLAYAPRGEVSKALMAGLAGHVLPEPDEEAAAPSDHPRRSWRRRRSA